MTRTTFKALWFGGGGLLATWLAVSPNDGVPGASPAALQRPAPARGPTAEELNAQATRLRNRTSAVTLRPSVRNPFRFGSRESAARSSDAPEPGVPSPSIESALPAVPAGPVLRLSGIAHTDGTRTAIISVGEQIYLVGEGQSVSGLFTVVAIDPEAVLLRDLAGTERRLALPQ